MLGSEVQKAVVAVLTGNAALSAMVSGRIYGDPPVNAVYPFIRFGRYERQPDDTNGTLGSTVDFTLEVHDRPKSGGRIAVLNISDSIIDLLHNTETALTLGGHTVWGAFFEDMDISRDADGLSYVSVILFRLGVQHG